VFFASLNRQKLKANSKTDWAQIGEIKF